MSKNKLKTVSEMNFKAELAIILGSGLGGFEDMLEDSRTVSYKELSDYPDSKVAGHKGTITEGTLHGKKVLVFSGRFHLYEGWSAKEVVKNIDTAKKAGCKTVIITNAAGGLKNGPGTLVSITDQINYTGTNPFYGSHEFYDMTEIYNKDLVELAMSIPTELKRDKGVYLSVLGPNYETPAEIKMYGLLGADLVGMSTVHEAMFANSLGMNVLGFTMVTNWAAGVTNEVLNHEEVKDVGQNYSPLFKEYLNNLIKKL